jgi:hypothetical protein
MERLEEIRARHHRPWIPMRPADMEWLIVEVERLRENRCPGCGEAKARTLLCRECTLAQHERDVDDVTATYYADAPTPAGPR